MRHTPKSDTTFSTKTMSYTRHARGQAWGAPTSTWADSKKNVRFNTFWSQQGPSFLF